MPRRRCASENCRYVPAHEAVAGRKSFASRVWTRPGSRLLFPSLCLPTGELPAIRQGALPSSRGLMMPTRRRTRAQDRARRIIADRALNADHVAQRDEPPSF